MDIPLELEHFTASELLEPLSNMEIDLLRSAAKWIYKRPNMNGWFIITQPKEKIGLSNGVLDWWAYSKLVARGLVETEIRQSGPYKFRYFRLNLESLINLLINEQ